MTYTGRLNRFCSMHPRTVRGKMGAEWGRKGAKWHVDSHRRDGPDVYLPQPIASLLPDIYIFDSPLILHFSFFFFKN